MELGIDADRREVGVIEVATSSVGEAPVLPELLLQFPADQPIGKLGADGAYDTRACRARSQRYNT